MSFLLNGPAPLWQPDYSSTFCVICYIDFSFFRRRHHCRVCGRLCCYECSKTRLFLSGQDFIRKYGNDPQRVCDICDKLIRVGLEQDTPKQDTTVTTTIINTTNTVEQNIVVVQNNTTIVEAPAVKNDVPAITEEDLISTVTVEEIVEEPQLLLQHQEKQESEKVEVVEKVEKVEEQQQEQHEVKKDMVEVEPVAAVEKEQEEQQVVTPVVEERKEEEKKEEEIQQQQEEEKKPEEVASDAPVDSVPSTTAEEDQAKAAIIAEEKKEEPHSLFSLASARVASMRLRNSSLRGTIIKKEQEGGDVQLNNNLTAKGRMRTMRAALNSRIQQASNAALLDVSVDGGDSTLPTPTASLIRTTPTNNTADGVDSTAVALPTATANTTTDTSAEKKSVAGRMSTVDLFNSLWNANSPIVIDTRDVVEYGAGHCPRAISVPLTQDDLTSGTTLADLEKRIPITNDVRSFKMRQRRVVVICGHRLSGEQLAQAEKQLQVSPDSELYSSVMQYQAPAHPICEYLADMLTKDNKVASVFIVVEGAEQFVKRYPFASCGAGANFTNKHTHIPMFPGFPSEIIDDSIFIGTQVDSANKQQLQKLGVTHVLNASSESPNSYEDDFEYLKLALDDSAEVDITETFSRAFEFIDRCMEEKGRLFIHCQLGVSRSATILIAYIMRSYNTTLHNAIAMVRSRRQQILPNKGFLKQLGRFEERLLKVDEDKSTYRQCYAELYPQ